MLSIQIRFLNCSQKPRLGCINIFLEIVTDDQVDCGIHQHRLCVILEDSSSKEIVCSDGPFDIYLISVTNLYPILLIHQDT